MELDLLYSAHARLATECQATKAGQPGRSRRHATVTVVVITPGVSRPLPGPGWLRRTRTPLWGRAVSACPGRAEKGSWALIAPRALYHFPEIGRASCRERV